MRPPAQTPSTQKSSPIRVTVAAGGTAGHLAPALAVAGELAARGCEVSFITSAGRGEERIVSARGFQVASFPIGGLPRRPGPRQLRALVRAIAGVLRCMAIVRRQRPDAVLAGGGFVSAPAAVAAWSMRIPVVVTEADAHLGLANRISARLSRRLCTAYPLEAHRCRQEVTGRPVEPSFLHVDRAVARGEHGLGDEDRMVAVIGGSGGATRLNEAAWEAWGGDDDPRVGGLPLTVVQVCGRRDWARFSAMHPASHRYRMLEWCDDMPVLLAACDLVVSRAGGSVFEIAAVGRAAVLVPSPNVTADHQRLNADYFARHGAAVMEEDATLDGSRLRECTSALLRADSDHQRERLARSMASMARPGAAGEIARVVRDLGAARRRRRSRRGEAA